MRWMGLKQFLIVILSFLYLLSPVALNAAMFSPVFINNMDLIGDNSNVDETNNETEDVSIDNGTENETEKKEVRSFQQDWRIGWWFEERKKEKKKRRKKKKKRKKKKYVLKKPVIPWDRLRTMHPKELGHYFNEALNYAVVYPTDENVWTVMRLNSEIARRSYKFAHVWARLAYLHPEYTEEYKIPWSRMHYTMVSHIEDKIKDWVMAFVKNNNGYLVVFTRKTCPYCYYYMYELVKFCNRWNFPKSRVEILDIDGYPKLALYFGATVVPDTFLFFPDTGKKARIMSGYKSADSIEEGVVRALYEIITGKIPYNMNKLYEDFYFYLQGLPPTWNIEDKKTNINLVEEKQND